MYLLSNRCRIIDDDEELANLTIDFSTPVATESLKNVRTTQRLISLCLGDRIGQPIHPDINIITRRI